MKKVSDRVARNRLLKLADFLDSLPKERFFFGHWGEPADDANVADGTDILKEANVCGTTACALGWTPSLPFAKKLGYKLSVKSSPCGQWGTFYKNGKVIGPYRMANALFGLNGRQCDCIFYPSRSPFNPELGEDASASDVAENIRQFVQVRFG